MDAGAGDPRGGMEMREKECPLILAGTMAGKSGYSACRLGECAWWDLEMQMCCVPAAAKRIAEKEDKNEN